MRGEWCFFKNHFSPDDCQKITELCSALPQKKAEIGVDGDIGLDADQRRSLISFMDVNDPNLSPLFDEMWKLALVANRQYFDFHISKLDYMQFAEYDELYRGEYKSHRDVFWINNDDYYDRKLSAVIQLTNPSEYEGGDLELLELQLNAPDKEEIRQQGSVIFFPSFLLHRANQVTKGKRHSIAAWFYGPKWR